MDRTVARVKAAQDLRRITRELTKVTNAFVEQKNRNLASELTDIELQLSHIAHELIEGLYPPLPAPCCEFPPDSANQMELPF